MSDLDTYICSKCGAGNCKLWRKLQSYPVKLKCAFCLSKKCSLPGRFNRKGLYKEKGQAPVLNIEWFIPAIRDQQQRWYGEGAEPKDLKWWIGRPTYSRKIIIKRIINCILRGNSPSKNKKKGRKL